MLFYSRDIKTLSNVNSFLIFEPGIEEKSKGNMRETSSRKYKSTTENNLGSNKDILALGLESSSLILLNSS